LFRIVRRKNKYSESDPAPGILRAFGAQPAHRVIRLLKSGRQPADLTEEEAARA